jgi:hypothetical protein
MLLVKILIGRYTAILIDGLNYPNNLMTSDAYRDLALVKYNLLVLDRV